MSVKLYSFEINRMRRIGAEVSGQLIDLNTAYEVLAGAQANPPPPRALPADLNSLVRLGSAGLEAVAQAVAHAKRRPAIPVGMELVYPFDAVRILAPLRPGKILVSPRDSKRGGEGCAEPSFFAKLPNSVVGPGEPIVKPRRIEQLDCEAGLAAVIGRRMKGVSEDEAARSVFGYTILQDVSAREGGQILGRNFDTFCPLGPCVVTAEELPEVGNLRWRSMVNGSEVRSGLAGDGEWSLAKLLSWLSEFMTLEPGDVVSAGTGGSVAVVQGDLLESEIEGIGRLTNPVK